MQLLPAHECIIVVFFAFVAVAAVADVSIAAEVTVMSVLAKQNDILASCIHEHNNNSNSSNGSRNDISNNITLQRSRIISGACVVGMCLLVFVVFVVVNMLSPTGHSQRTCVQLSG